VSDKDHIAAKLPRHLLLGSGEDAAAIMELVAAAAG